MTKRNPWAIAALATAALAMLLHGYTAFILTGAGVGSFTVPFFVWSMLPYALCLGVGMRKNAGVVGFGGAIPALCVDAMAHHSAFSAPESSTASIGLMFAPLANLVVVAPLGMLVGMLARRYVRVASKVPAAAPSP